MNGVPDLVIHVLTALDYGGVERRMEILGTHPDGARMRHMFVAIGHGGATECHLTACGCDVRCLNHEPRIPNPKAVSKLVRLFRSLRPRVVHTHGAEANFHGLIAARMTSVPIRVGEEVGIPSHSWRARQVFRAIYSETHAVIGMSRDVVNWLIASGEVAPAKAVEVYNPVLLPAMRPHDPPHSGNTIRIGFTGRLEPVKNPMVLIDVLSVLHDNAIAAELLLIGDGSQRDALNGRARELGLADHLILPGFQEHPEEWLRTCQLYVQPSLSEGFGIALIEAMACGLPVVASPFGGASRMIENGCNGWLTRGPDAESMTATVREALALTPEQLQAVGRRARASVEGRFDPARYVIALEDFYERLDGQRTPRTDARRDARST